MITGSFLAPIHLECKCVSEVYRISHSNDNLTFVFFNQVIRQYRPGRTIILTTHFMDEADLLSDRIAIMADGCLRCVGSSLFLKKTYGVGYQLTIEKAVQRRPAVIEEDHDDSKMNHNGSVETGVAAEGALVPESVDDTLRDIVSGAVSEAHLLTNVGTEMSFQLPLGASANFKPMFESLDEQMERHTIETYGVSITTLEEVFLLVSRGAHINSSKKNLESSRGVDKVSVNDDANGKTASGDRSVRSKMNLETNRLFYVHLSALFKKRAINFKRDKKAWCCTTILPSIFVLIGFLVSKFASTSRDFVAVKLDLNDYNVNVQTGPRNPIPFNPNESSICSYAVATQFDTILTGETYQFCGTQARLNGTGRPMCSISESTSFLDRITVAGASPMAENASDVLSVS